MVRVREHVSSRRAGGVRGAVTLVSVSPSETSRVDLSSDTSRWSLRKSRPPELTSPDSLAMLASHLGEGEGERGRGAEGQRGSDTLTQTDSCLCCFILPCLKVCTRKHMREILKAFQIILSTEWRLL